MKSVVLFILFSLTLHTSNKNTPKSWGKGLAVVQYNADFNKNNSVKNLQRLSDARIFNAWIDKQPELKTENGSWYHDEVRYNSSRNTRIYRRTNRCK